MSPPPSFCPLFKLDIFPSIFLNFKFFLFFLLINFSPFSYVLKWQNIYLKQNKITSDIFKIRNGDDIDILVAIFPIRRIIFLVTCFFFF